MTTMDLSTNQEAMGVQSRFEYAHHMFKEKDTFEETDIQGNINLFNTLKTEANSNHDHDSSSLLQVKCLNESEFEVDNDLFSYSSFKKAMDLRTHNRTLDGVRRTIFDDAEYFAKNYCYKLLPITLEPVDETVIQVEHNYSLMSVNSESEPEENCSRTMDYSQVKEKNYKRRRTKFREGSDVDEDSVECDSCDIPHNGFNSSPILHEDESLTAEEEQQNASPEVEIDNSVQPLDLSAAPVVQEEKTDANLRESPSSIVGNEEVALLDSDKENLNSELNGVLVTITRPDEKENYQPCDLFLNDIARLVPRLIDKDCLEVDILDRTCDHHDEFRKHRLYYVISESTWRLFQKTNERVILTNDQSLGQPIRRAEEEDEKPSYLVFDQFSLAKCLADYCQEIGGCFEYTCVEEEEKVEACLGKEEEERVEEEKVEPCVAGEVEECKGTVPETEKETQKVGEIEEKKTVDVLEKEPKEEKTEEVSQELNDVTAAVVKSPKDLPEDVEEAKQDSSEVDDVSQNESPKSEEEKAAGTVVPSPEPEEESAPRKAVETKEKPPDQVEEIKKKETEKPKQLNPDTAVNKTKNNTKKRSRGTKRKRKSSIQRKPKMTRTTSRVQSVPECETSQKSDKPVSRRGKREQTVAKEEPPNKLIKSSVPEEPYRKTRSGKVLQEVKTNKPTAKNKKSAGLKKEKQTENRPKTRSRDEKRMEDTGRSLRSHKTTQWKEKVQVWSKTKGRKR